MSGEARGRQRDRFFVGGVEIEVVSDDAPRVLDEHGLTAAEREIASLLVDGLSNAEIARRRGTSPRTVEKQVASCLRRLRAVRRRPCPSEPRPPGRTGAQARKMMTSAPRRCCGACTSTRGRTASTRRRRPRRSSWVGWLPEEPFAAPARSSASCSWGAGTAALLRIVDAAL